MEDELRVTTDVGDVIDIYLDPIKTPVAYQRKKKELMQSAGMTESEAESCLLRPIPIELFYSYDQGLFGIEAECLADCDIHNPHIKEKVMITSKHPLNSQRIVYM